MTCYRFCGVLAVGLALGMTAPAQNKDLKHTKEEQQMFDLVNAARGKDKLPAYKAEPLLIEVAREHAANMAKQKKSTTDRLTAAGYMWLTSSENVNRSRDLAKLDGILDSWLKSAFAKENMLSDKYEEIGVGIAPAGADPKDGFYISAVFAAKKK